jgi:transcriptional repressor NrdR
VGLAILGPLQELDKVAYLRFASVYRSFETLEDFEREISILRQDDQPSQSPIKSPIKAPTQLEDLAAVNGRHPEHN